MDGVLHLTYIAALLRAATGDTTSEALPADIQRLLRRIERLDQEMQAGTPAPADPPGGKA